jgi:hypothetical protein
MTVITIHNEAYQGFGISAYPDVEGNQKIMAALDKIDLGRYVEAVTYLGVSMM